MGIPRRALAINSATKSSKICQWLRNIGLNIEKLCQRDHSRQEIGKQIAHYFGFSVDDEENTSATVLKRLLRQELTTRRADSYEVIANANTARFAALLSLDSDSQEIINFLASVGTEYTLEAAAQNIEIRSQHQYCERLGAVLGIPPRRIQQALAASAPLSAFRLLQKEYLGGSTLSSFIELKSDVLQALLADVESDNDLVRPFFQPADAPTVEWDDYRHLSKEVDLARRYLRAASEKKEIGVNLLFVGLAGSGKTELARLLGHELDLKTFEVKVERDNGMAADTEERLASYLMAQKYLSASHKSLLIFDEVEDVFDEASGENFFRLGQMEGKVQQHGKLWLHRQLENNAVPTIWIANSADAIDRAHLRRFDYSIRFTTLPVAARKKVLTRHIGHLNVSQVCFARLADRYAVLPAQISTAAKVASALHEKQSDDTLLHLIDTSMKLLRQPLSVSSTRAIEFDLALVNADHDLSMLLAGLRRNGGTSRVCLAGPSGSGKTAFAHHVAHQLDRRCRTVAASDLLSAYVGESEKKIRDVFTNATAKEEVLLFDEADSFLQQRDRARAHWEVTFVNEMLARLEEFGGLVFFTTNRRDAFDQAASRRFDFKVKFAYLDFNQCITILETSSHHTIRDNDLLLARLRRLNCLTPGDFSSAGRAQRLLGADWSASDWLTALEREHANKKEEEISTRL